MTPNEARAWIEEGHALLAHPGVKSAVDTLARMRTEWQAVPAGKPPHPMKWTRNRVRALEEQERLQASGDADLLVRHHTPPEKDPTP